MTEQPSGKLYTAVTKYWPRMAAGLVVIAGISEWVIGGLTADTSVEFYLMAWAATTGGLWFMFEKAEAAVSGEMKTSAATWLTGSNVQGGIEAMPGQFASLFDRVFGERHLTIRCFLASGMASLVSVAVVVAVWIVKCVRRNETPAGLRFSRGWGFPRSWVAAALAA